MTIADAITATLEPDQSILAILDPTGDTKLTWARSNQEEISIARDAFNKARAKGFMAFRMEGKEGTKGAVMGEFDATAERVILIPPLAGGR